MDYHDLYLKMFGATEDTVDMLDTTIYTLTTLRKKLVSTQQEAENAVIGEGDELVQRE